MAISPKQEAFCLAYMLTGKASEAYREAGYSPNMSDKTVNEASSRLMKNSNVIARLAELRKPVAEAAQISLKEHLDSLRGLRDRADSSEKYGPAIQAEVAMGKASGLYVDKIQIDISIGLAERMKAARERTRS